MNAKSLFSAIGTGLFAATALAQPYSIDWYTIAGGGGTSTDGVYSVAGTIGQAAAGKLNSNGYELYAGFWGIIAVPPRTGGSHTFTTNDSPGAASTFLNSINELGQIVGVHLSSNLQHSLLTDVNRSSFTVFDPPNGGPRPGGGFGGVSGAAASTTRGKSSGACKMRRFPQVMAIR